VIKLFESFLSQELRRFLNQEIAVAVGETLFRGILLAVEGTFIRLIESSEAYERGSSVVFIQLDQVSFIQVNASLATSDNQTVLSTLADLANPVTQNTISTLAASLARLTNQNNQNNQNN